MGISGEQALDCFRSEDLVGLGMEADAVRRRLHPEGVGSYAMGCKVECAAVAALDKVYAAIGESVERGGTGLRLDFGGADGDAVAAVLRGVRQRFPGGWVEGLAAGGVVATWEGCGVWGGGVDRDCEGLGVGRFGDDRAAAGCGAGCDLRGWGGSGGFRSRRVVQ